MAKVVLVLERVCKSCLKNNVRTGSKRDDAAKTKSEGASAEDSGSYNFHRN